MTHEQLLNTLAQSSGPATASDLAAALGFPASAEANACVEVFAALSPELRRRGNGWMLSADAPARRVLTALRSYSDAHPTKSVFRAVAALGDLSAQEQPTEDQLREILSSTADFKLLPNAMIKRVS